MMNKHIKKYFFFSFLLFSFFSQAQKYNINIELVTDNVGHTPSSSSSFVQDESGFIWIGTVDGLIRFDGFNFKVYKHQVGNENSLSNNIVRALEIDEFGNIWIGTQSGGLNKLNPLTGKFTSYKHSKENQNSLSNNNVGVLHSDKKGNLWIGTWENGLDKFDLKNEKFTHYSYKTNENSISGNEIRQIFCDKKGILWIGTLNKGLNSLNPKTEIFKSYKLNSSVKGLANNSVYAICEDNSGALWLGTTGSGLYKFDTKSKSFTPCKKNEISKVIFNIKEKANGTLAIATDKGLFLLPKNREKVISVNTDNYANLKTDRLRNLFVDREDNLWIGTEVGANKLIENQAFVSFQHNHNNKNSLAGKIIRSVLEDKEGILWVGTLGQGLNKYDSKTGQVTRIDFSTKNDSLLGSEITNLYEDSLGNFWVGCWGKGLFLLNRKTLKVLEIYQNNNSSNALTDNRIQSIIEERKGVLWISTENGLNRFDYINQKWLNFNYDYSNKNSVSGNKFQSKALAIDKNGTIWAGTWANGLNAITSTNNIQKPYVFRHWKNSFTNSNSLSSNSIISIKFDSKNNLWLGTYGGGVDFVSSENLKNLEENELVFKNYTTDNGLANNIIYGILEDQQANIWFSTDNGLSVFNTKNKKFKNYKTINGLLNNQFFWGASAGTRKEKLYFGTVDGLTLVLPEKIKLNNTKLQLEITDIHFSNSERQTKFIQKLGTKNINSVKKIEVSSQASSFSIQYISPNFRDKSKLKYAYKLEGFDEAWNYVQTKREIEFNNLAKGTYLLKLKVMSSNSYWSEEKIFLEIIVLPPYWNTWWFAILVFVIVSSIISALYFYNLNRLKKQKYELELKVEERTKALHKKNEQFKLKNEKIAKQKETAEKQKQKTDRINKDLNDFAYIISHDLKAPLRGISQLATWISDDYADKFDEDGKQQMRMLIGRVKTMDGMINGVLEYSRATNFIGTFETLNLNELLLEIIELMHPPETIEVNILDNFPSIIGDKVRIMQVFQNLISNAIKYMDKPKGIVTIRFVDKITHWQFCVEDNGAGIEEKFHENVFKIFQTIASTKTDDSTGIGLSIVKKIVQIYKGEIWLESEIGVGSKFCFTLSKKIG